jgi:hypothetical protein
MYQKAPIVAPKGRDSDESWVTYRILTPEQVTELEEEGRIGWGDRKPR